MNMSHVTIRPIHNGFVAVISTIATPGAMPLPKELSFPDLEAVVVYLKDNGFEPLT